MQVTIRLSDFKQEWCTWTQKYAFHDPEPPKLKSQIFVRGGKNSCSVLWVFNENQTKGNYHHKWTGTAQRAMAVVYVWHILFTWDVMSLAPWQKKHANVSEMSEIFFLVNTFVFLGFFLLLLLFFTGMVIQLSESHTSNLLGNGNKASVYIKLTKK